MLTSLHWKYFWLATFAILLLGGCNTTMGNRAYNFQEPVVDPDIQVEIYDQERAWAGTTIFADNHIEGRPRVIEVNMKGEIVWEYQLPKHLRRYNNPGFDVEALANGNVLLMLPRYGVHEINRAGTVVWSYLDSKVSHDADRLANGNTLVVFGHNDSPSDYQVKEIDRSGKMVWGWKARKHFWRDSFKNMHNKGWTHTNAAERLTNGNTLVSLRNFNIIAELDPRGKVLRTMGKGILWHQHDPEMLAGGLLLTANHTSNRAVEIDPLTNKMIWNFAPDEGKWRVRDADRLPNGNTLITDATKIAEITRDGEIVWLLKVKGVSYEKGVWPRFGFFKAQRITASD